jgi:CelD/BcsL family acetyltransferase involved in cellulose biosynthesis
VNRLTHVREFEANALHFSPQGALRTNRIAWEIHLNLEAASKIWTQFQRVAATTFYNTLAWSASWQTHVGTAAGALPRIVVGRHERDGSVAFILPLQIRRVRAVRLLEWHGTPDINYGFGLYDRAFLPWAEDWFAAHLDGILAAAGAHDAVNFLDMPAVMSGHPHPLSRHFNMRGPNRTFSLRLGPDYETVYSRKRPVDSRRANQRADNRLLEMGDVRFFTPHTEQELNRHLDDMLTHKTAQLAQRGIHGVFDAPKGSMVHELGRACIDGEPLTRAGVLTLDGATLAVTFGGVADSTYWFYISSLSPDAAARKFSPGDHALRKTIEACCREGLTTFDFGVGDALYKSRWADVTTPLHVMLRARTFKGLVWTMQSALRLICKRAIKEHALLLDLAAAIRKFARGRPA